MYIEPTAAQICHEPLTSELFRVELENEILLLDQRIQKISQQVFLLESELESKTSGVRNSKPLLEIRLGKVMIATDPSINTALVTMRKEQLKLYERNEVRVFMLELHKTEPEILQLSVASSFTEADRQRTLSFTELFIQKNRRAINTFVQGHHTALTRAISLNSEPSVRFLLEHGARVNLADGFGTLPLAEASRLPNLAISTLLLQYGADMYQLTPEKFSLLTNALSKKKDHLD
jgi:hypothetical protein